MEDPQKWARVRAFRAEVAGAVRAGEFGDLRGLVQELSTGVQAELDKLQAKLAELEKAQAELAERAKQPAAAVGAEPLQAISIWQSVFAFRETLNRKFLIRVHSRPFVVALSLCP